MAVRSSQQAHPDRQMAPRRRKPHERQAGPRQSARAEEPQKDRTARRVIPAPNSCCLVRTRRVRYCAHVDPPKGEPAGALQQKSRQLPPTRATSRPDFYSTGITIRKLMFRDMEPGSAARRSAQRANMPSRTTRVEPVAEPTGSSTGLIA